MITGDLLAAKGHRILSSSPGWEDATPYRLHQVTDEGGNRITSDYVDSKPGIAAHVRAWDAEQFEVTYYVDDLDAAGLILRPEKAAYFQTLHDWGYPLSPVEKIAAMLPDEN